MSYYYKYSFVSPEPIFSTVKEELKSYFDTGAIDDLMFPTYVDKCLRKLGKATYKINEDVMEIEDFQSRLPDDFVAVREAWMCTEVNALPYQTPSSFYSQAATSTTIQIIPMTVGGVPCNAPGCIDDACDPCMPEIAQAVYKTNNELMRTFRQVFLLKPGNITVLKNCDATYTDMYNMFSNTENPYGSQADSFDIRGNKFVTNFRNGVVHLIYYSYERDDVGNQLIPDNYRIREYIEAFLKYKVFETLGNMTADETFNQLQQKMIYYKQLADEAYILAETEIMKQSAWDKQRRIKKHLNSLNMYELPRTSNWFTKNRNS